MLSNAPNPAPAAPAANPAMSQGPAAGGDMFASGKMPAFRSHPHGPRTNALIAGIKAIVAGLFMGLSPGGAMLLAGAASLTAGKAVAPLAHNTGGTGPLVTSTGGEDLAHRGCVSCNSHQGAAHSSGMT